MQKHLSANLCGLVLEAVFLTKRYINPAISQTKKQERQRIKVLREEYARLNLEKEITIKRCNAEKKQGQWLLNKITLWQTVIKKCEYEHEQELKNSQELVKNYLYDQAKSLALEKIRIAIVPSALSAVEKKLETMFTREQDQKNFLEKSIAELKDRAA